MQQINTQLTSDWEHFFCWMSLTACKFVFASCNFFVIGNQLPRANPHRLLWNHNTIKPIGIWGENRKPNNGSERSYPSSCTTQYTKATHTRTSNVIYSKIGRRDLFLCGFRVMVKSAFFLCICKKLFAGESSEPQ